MTDNPYGVVLAMAVPHKDETRRERGEKITVYWRGPQDPGRWSVEQRDAARFASEDFARAHLDVQCPPDSHPNATWRGDSPLWSEPVTSLANRPISDQVITEPPPGVSVPAPRPAPEQGDLLDHVADVETVGG